MLKFLGLAHVLFCVASGGGMEVGCEVLPETVGICARDSPYRPTPVRDGDWSAKVTFVCFNPRTSELNITL